MRWLFVILALVFAASLSAQAAPPPYERLSNDEILGKVDDATASEMRLLPGSDFFADGGVGFNGETPRAATAYLRLLKAGKPEPFKWLCLSDDDLTAMYGLKGLAKLAPDRLRFLMAKFARRREPVQSMSGCISGDTSLALEALELACGLTGIEDRHLKTACVKAWLGAVRDQGARQSDDSCARRCRALAPELLSEPTPQARYALLLAERHETEMTRVISDVSAEKRLRRLCTDYLARQHCRDSWKPSGFDRDAVAWLNAGELPGKEWYVIVSARAWQIWAPPLLPFSHKFSHKIARDEDLLSEWQSLKPIQWKALLAHPNSLIRNATRFLQGHPVTGWRNFSDPPFDSNARKLWLMTCLAKAQTGDELTPVLEYLAANPADYPFVCRGRTYAWHRVKSCEPECAEALRSWLDSLIGHADLELRLAGFDMIRTLQEADGALFKALFSNWDVNKNIERALSLIEQCSEQVRWQYRARLVPLLNELRDAYPQYGPMVRSWRKELCKLVVSNPRALPVREFEYYDDDERAREFIEGFLNGRSHFVPEAEAELETENETLEVLWDRLKSACARLD